MNYANTTPIGVLSGSFTPQDKPKGSMIASTVQILTRKVSDLVSKQPGNQGGSLETYNGDRNAIVSQAVGQLKDDTRFTGSIEALRKATELPETKRSEVIARACASEEQAYVMSWFLSPTKAGTDSKTANRSSKNRASFRKLWSRLQGNGQLGSGQQVRGKTMQVVGSSPITFVFVNDPQLAADTISSLLNRNMGLHAGTPINGYNGRQIGNERVTSLVRDPEQVVGAKSDAEFASV